MKQGMDGSAALMRNLEDAGCSDATIERFMACSGEGECARQLKILCRYRCQLLEQVHQEQKKLECLDDLIYTIKKHQKEKEKQL